MLTAQLAELNNKVPALEQERDRATRDRQVAEARLQIALEQTVPTLERALVDAKLREAAALILHKL